MTMDDRIRQKRLENKLTLEALGYMLGVNVFAVSKYARDSIKSFKIT